MTREDNRPNGLMAVVARQNSVAGFAVDFLVQMHEHAVVMHGDSRWRDLLITFEARSREHHVNGLYISQRRYISRFP